RPGEEVARVGVAAQQRFDPLTQGRVPAAGLVEEGRPFGGIVQVQRLEEDRPFVHRGTLRSSGHGGAVPRGATLPPPPPPGRAPLAVPRGLRGPGAARPGRRTTGGRPSAGKRQGPRPPRRASAPRSSGAAPAAPPRGRSRPAGRGPRPKPAGPRE